MFRYSFKGMVSNSKYSMILNVTVKVNSWVIKKRHTRKKIIFFINLLTWYNPHEIEFVASLTFRTLKENLTDYSNSNLILHIYYYNFYCSQVSLDNSSAFFSTDISFTLI